MADVFISYKREDKDRIQPIARGLRTLGLEVFTDYDSLPPGRSWIEGLIIKVRMARCVVGCWTHNSVNSQGLFTSENVQAEHQEGRGKLLPAILDKGCLPFSYDASQGVDFSSWNGGLDDEQWKRFAVAAKQMCTPKFVQHELAAAERKQSEIATLLQSMKASYETSVARIHELELESGKLQGKCKALEMQLSRLESQKTSQEGRDLEAVLVSANEALEFERLFRKKLENQVWELEQQLHEANYKTPTPLAIPSVMTSEDSPNAKSPEDSLSSSSILFGQPKPAKEPSMAEILASIRKIISED